MPSALDDISSVEMLESLITNDPRWAWILGAWEASADEEQVALARTVHRFRGNFVKETAGLVLKVLGDIQGPDDVKKYTSSQAKSDAWSTDNCTSDRPRSRLRDRLCSRWLRSDE